MHLHEYNRWADQRLLETLRTLPLTALAEERAGMYDSILGVLAHIAQVQIGYVGLMTAAERRLVERDSIEEIAAIMERAGAGLVELAGGDLERSFHIPWFERDFTVAQGLRQVLTHSIHHRADINGWLPGFGVESLELDYIDWVR